MFSRCNLTLLPFILSSSFLYGFILNSPSLWFDRCTISTFKLSTSFSAIPVRLPWIYTRMPPFYAWFAWKLTYLTSCAQRRHAIPRDQNSSDTLSRVESDFRDKAELYYFVVLSYTLTELYSEFKDIAHGNKPIARSFHKIFIICRIAIELLFSFLLRCSVGVDL